MGRTVFITGASRGIGAVAAELFYSNGYNVVINYNNSEKEAQLLSKKLPGSLALKGDVSSEKDVAQMFEKAISHFGKIDVLVNNAGVSFIKLLTDTTLEDWERLFKTNVTGTFLASKYAAENMIANHSGKIINVSSAWGRTGASCESCYSASKGAVIAFTKALAKELGPSGIAVNCIAPGFIDTDMNKEISPEDKKAFCDDIPLLRIGTPSEVAQTMLFLASDSASYITGQIIGCDGGAVI